MGGDKHYLQNQHEHRYLDGRTVWRGHAHHTTNTAPPRLVSNRLLIIVFKNYYYFLTNQEHRLGLIKERSSIIIGK